MDSKAAGAADRATHESLLMRTNWTDTLWSLRISRPADFRFEPGHYARLGLEQPDGSVLWRPYSIVSAPDDAALEFLVVRVAGGPFTQQLDQLAIGQPVLLDPAAYGFFIARQLLPGGTLWMLATGTGLGPYVSLLRTPGALHAFARVILVHSVRHRDDLAYRTEIEQAVASAPQGLTYIPVVTRDTVPGLPSARIPALIADGSLQDMAGVALTPDSSRVMVCGHPDFTADMRRLLGERGFTPCRRASPGSMLFEKYW